MKNLDKQITEIMEGCYIPSLADSIRIYKEYRENKEELAAILSEVYEWLAHEPVCIDYKHGKLYMRCEMQKPEELGNLFVVHYIYINPEKNVAIENYFSEGDGDITESPQKELISLAKEMVREDMYTMQDCEF